MSGVIPAEPAAKTNVQLSNANEHVSVDWPRQTGGIRSITERKAGGKQVRLRRSALSKPGIARKRRGKGFAYYGPDGELLADNDTLERIKGLVIPPAWKK